MGKRLAILVAVVFALPRRPRRPRRSHRPPSCSPAAPPSGLQDRLFEEAAASGAEYVRVDVELHGIFAAAATSPTGATSIA